MCGRFTLAKAPAEVQQLFKLAELPDFLQPRYNIAPTQPVAVVGLKPDGAAFGLRMVRWGLIPHWTENPKKQPPLINARSEGIDGKPTFAEAFRRNRCLVPADGYYEWIGAGKTKRGFHIHRADRGLMAFAGLWDAWTGDDGKPVLSCTIITTTAASNLSSLHDRMPVIVPPDRFSHWLAPRAEPSQLKALLVPAEGLEAVAVGPAVNSVANEGPQLLEPDVRQTDSDAGSTVAG